MSAIQLKVRSTPNNDLVHLNLAYVAPNSVDPDVRYVQINHNVFTVSAHQDVAAGEIALNGYQRKSLRVSPGDICSVIPFTIPTKKFLLDSLSIEVDFVIRKAASIKIDGQRFIETFRRRYANQVFAVGQMWVMDFEGNNYLLTALDVAIFDEATTQVVQSSATDKLVMGMVCPDTKPLLKIHPEAAKSIKLHNMPLSTASRGSEMFKKDFNFENLGIGGLNNQFANIFRRAFASRIFPPSVVAQLGIQHVKGIMLYGPPGTGKTLMARQIGKMLNCKEPKIVNGPEVLNKFVGQAEENIRNLFRDAESEFKQKGDDSELHLIIFDEIDAICKTRGTTRDGTGVMDSLVNQLLSKIDGVEALNNVLLIGMTNRKDLIDEALLRPGRFEVLIEVGLPDEEGRLQIFKIHTKDIRANGFLAADVDLEELAHRSKNFSGAEIAGLIKSATSFAMTRQVDVNNLTKPIDPKSIRIGRDDFMRAFQEVKSAFGVEEEELDKYTRNGLLDYGLNWQQIMQQCKSFIHQLTTSQRTESLTVLMEGPSGSGKTAVAATLAKLSGFPYIKFVTGEALVGYPEMSKCNIIRKVFDDAYKSPSSVIVLDDLERLVEYTSLGPRFSNAVLQTLLVLIKKQSPKGHKLLVIGTSSSLDVLDSLDLASTFNVTMHISALQKMIDEVACVVGLLKVHFASSKEKQDVLEILPKFIGIKTLMLVCEMAQALSSESGGLPRKSDFVQALKNCGCHLDGSGF